jgi:hypothetical protein
MYVHDATGLAYLANPRTASRATAQALEGVGFRMVGSHHSGPEALYGDKYVMALLDRDSRFFTTVRDLLDTIGSWGRHLGMAEGLSDGTVLARVLAQQLPIIEGWEPWTLFPHARVADRLLRYEHLDAELNALLAEYGLGPVTLERVE